MPPALRTPLPQPGRILTGRRAAQPQPGEPSGDGGFLSGGTCQAEQGETAVLVGAEGRALPLCLPDLCSDVLAI